MKVLFCVVLCCVVLCCVALCLADVFIRFCFQANDVELVSTSSESRLFICEYADCSAVSITDPERDIMFI
jgi:hypothetical protein